MHKACLPRLRWIALVLALQPLVMIAAGAVLSVSRPWSRAQPVRAP